MFKFSIGTKGDQITPKDSEAEIGQRKELSKKDIEGLNKYYGCGNYILVIKRKVPLSYLPTRI